MRALISKGRTGKGESVNTGLNHCSKVTVFPSLPLRTASRIGPNSLETMDILHHNQSKSRLISIFCDCGDNDNSHNDNSHSKVLGAEAHMLR